MCFMEEISFMQKSLGKISVVYIYILALANHRLNLLTYLTNLIFGFLIIPVE